MKPKNLISVYEYDRLKLGSVYNGIKFSESLLEDLERFHSSCKIRYFNLIHNGIEFCEYVGVIQIGKIQIEVLPKLDKQLDDRNVWRDLLIGMLRETSSFRVTAPSNSSLTLKSNSILELYFDIFITELEYLVRTGLIRQYRKDSYNQPTLKGAIDLPRHLSKNCTHKENFYTRATVYDHDHIWHSVFSQTIRLIRLLSENAEIHNRVGALQLDFPEVKNRAISIKTFEKLIYTRKTESYRTAIDIARLLLLGFHPDLSSGSNHVLALMFDMNLLWESFVYHSLRKQFIKNSSPYSIRAQASKPFWSAQSCRKTLRPDILIESETESFVLDTKWKVISNSSPAPSDLQQLFAYSQFFRSAKNALIYPGHQLSINDGFYKISTPWADTISCSMVHLGIKPNIKNWQQDIYRMIRDWLEG